MSYTQITGCRACGHGQHENILSLGNQYIPAFPDKKDESLPRSPLEVVSCKECGLLQLKHSVSPDLLWGESYWYRSSVNQTMRDALSDVVRQGLEHHTRGVWLDIGANDGFLISRVLPSFTKIACEPSKPFRAELEEHADIVIPDFFSADHDCLRGPLDRGVCDVITSCAMFYDLDDPGQFVRDIASCLAPGGVWISQLSANREMFERTAFDNICHEHRCYYDEATLYQVYSKNGMEIVSVDYNEVNGGSMRVLARRAVEVPVPYVPFHLPEGAAQAFAERVRKWKQLMGWIVDSSDMSGMTMWGYGASTKGTVLLQYLDRNERIMAVADRNPQKHGRYMVGSWLPITSESEMRRSRPNLLLVLPWAFRSEFIQRERSTRDAGAAMLFPLPNPEFVL